MEIAVDAHARAKAEPYSFRADFGWLMTASAFMTMARSIASDDTSKIYSRYMEARFQDNVYDTDSMNVEWDRFFAYVREIMAVW